MMRFNSRKGTLRKTGLSDLTKHQIKNFGGVLIKAVTCDRHIFIFGAKIKTCRKIINLSRNRVFVHSRNAFFRHGRGQQRKTRATTGILYGAATKNKFYLKK